MGDTGGLSTGYQERKENKRTDEPSNECRGRRRRAKRKKVCLTILDYNLQVRLAVTKDI